MLQHPQQALSCQSAARAVFTVALRRLHHHAWNDSACCSVHSPFCGLSFQMLQPGSTGFCWFLAACAGVVAIRDVKAHHSGKKQGVRPRLSSLKGQRRPADCPTGA